MTAEDKEDHGKGRLAGQVPKQTVSKPDPSTLTIQDDKIDQIVIGGAHVSRAHHPNHLS